MTSNSPGRVLLGKIFFDSWTTYKQRTYYDDVDEANALPIMIALWIQLAILMVVIAIGYTHLYHESKNVEIKKSRAKDRKPEQVKESTGLTVNSLEDAAIEFTRTNMSFDLVSKNIFEIQLRYSRIYYILYI